MILNSLAEETRDTIRALVSYRIQLATADQSPIDVVSMEAVIRSISEIIDVSESELTIINNHAQEILEELNFPLCKIWSDCSGFRNVYGNPTQMTLLDSAMFSPMLQGMRLAVFWYNKCEGYRDTFARSTALNKLLKAFSCTEQEEEENYSTRVALAWLLNQVLDDKLPLYNLTKDMR
jgi:hypothetical protein